MSEGRPAQRHADYPVDSMFLQRWSPRAFSGVEISDLELCSLFEAARWAPSSGNNQPWRFLYAKRSSADWNLFFNLLAEGNRVWCVSASVLMVVISKKTRLGAQGGERPNECHSFDTGAAWVSLAFQALKTGWAAHGIEGFDKVKARFELRIPEVYHIEAMIAVGRPAPKSILPEALQAREFPNGRQPVEAFAFSGTFPQNLI